MEARCDALLVLLLSFLVCFPFLFNYLRSRKKFSVIFKKNLIVSSTPSFLIEHSLSFFDLIQAKRVNFIVPFMTA